MLQQDADQLKLLSILHYVMAAVMGLGAIGWGVYFAFSVLFVGGGLTQGGGEGAVAVGALFMIITGIGLVIAGVMTFFTYLCGRFLARRQNWLFCMVVAGVHCLNFPIGTVLGVFTLIVLARQSVKCSFVDG